MGFRARAVQPEQAGKQELRWFKAATSNFLKAGRRRSGSLPWQYEGMAIAQSKVTAQGQISVPADVRRKLGVGPGSVLEWKDEGDQVVVRRVGRFTSADIHQAVFGSKRPKKRSLDELKAGIRSHARKRYARG